MDDLNRPLLSEDGVDPDALFGGRLARKQLEQQLVRKLDKRCAILVAIYVLNYIDRNNASAARLHGFEQDLGLTDTQFSQVLAVLYAGYLLMQIPSNMFLNYIGRPSIYLPGCMVLWGTLSALTGFATNFASVMWTRFFIGITEAAFFPCVATNALMVGGSNTIQWGIGELSSGTFATMSNQLRVPDFEVVYPQGPFCHAGRSLAMRLEWVSFSEFGAVSDPPAFKSLIASGILDVMDGRIGYAAWRWLFFIEGGMTVAVAILAMFILPDFPENSSNWLSVPEQTLAQRRMVEDSGESKLGSESVIGGLTMAIWDWQVWWLALALTFVVLSLSFNAYFPTLAETMGYGKTLTLLLCAPPWFVATIVGFAVSRHSDRVGERFWHITCPFLIGMVGFLLAMSTMQPTIRYISLFFMASSYAGFIVYLSWISGTIRPASKRAVALALINMISSLGNVFGSFIFPSSWGPSYRTSYSICMCASSVGILLSFVFRQHLASLNAKQVRRELEEDEPQGYRYLL
ncbi:MFS general substrate transporter [Mycena indigotica]|uniref:MFS general substrate transporter n=1 Tax=Mycena indigotica TaxID=2126181 RepID=A0A8H6SNS2_9AGAR|nr:MFS general substrate transporter [Mycena indigotica]KAF7301632.1 MFS general substrate transporter [Mycena indigotica]